MRTITRPQMNPQIAVTKLTQVNDLVFKATSQFRGSRTSMRNTQIFLYARSMAHTGDTISAFALMAKTVVPAGSISPCCMLYSSRYGCSSHGYPRTI